MKNIHILPTDKPSRLFYNVGGALLFTNYENRNGVNIYITSDETAYPYALHLKNQEVLKINGVGEISGALYHDKGVSYPEECQKIILTDNKELIKNGVQAIDDEFLEWFIKNPSCEEVVIEDYGNLYNFRYLILIPKEEEVKEETLEEAALKYASEKLRRIIIPYKEFNANVAEYVGFTNGAKWQQERMYSEMDIVLILSKFRDMKMIAFSEWFEQFKKK